MYKLTSQHRLRIKTFDYYLTNYQALHNTIKTTIVDEPVLILELDYSL